MKKYSIIMYLLGIAVIVVAIISTTGIMAFVDIPSLVITGFLSFIMMFTVYSPKEVCSAFKLAMEKNEGSVAELKNASLFFSTLQKLLIISSLLGTLIGVIILHSSDAVSNGGIAASLLTVFYALILMVFLTVPFKTAIEKKINKL